MQVLFRGISQLVTCRGGAKRGTAMRDLGVIEDGAILVENGKIKAVGTRQDLEKEYRGEIYECGNKLVMPGFVDSHTHLIFGGQRADEFGWRLRGDSYLSIMNRGGGIVKTVEATRTASFYELKERVKKYLTQMRAMGVTTCEIKSGYGLDLHTERKQLEVISALKDVQPTQLTATFMGAHAVPTGKTADEYINFCIEESLPAVVREGLCEFADVFIEEGAFTVRQAEAYLRRAQSLGLKIKLHADEMTSLGGTELGILLKACSVDHLLKIREDAIEKLAKTDTVATVLPLTAFCLGEEYAPARKLIDAGATVAAASDFNPGSCCTYSIPLLIALLCIYMKLSIEETITALTINGAKACGKEAVASSIEKGKRADFVLFDCDHYRCLPYYTGLNLVEKVFIEGELVYGNVA